MVGYFGLMNGGNINKTKIFERGSLIIEKKHRGKGLGKILRGILLEEHREKAIFSVTNVSHVIKSNLLIGEKAIIQKDLPLLFKNEIENAGALLPDDIIFVNSSLHSLITI